jgi:hypothetical protein
MKYRRSLLVFLLTTGWLCSTSAAQPGQQSKASPTPTAIRGEDPSVAAAATKRSEADLAAQQRMAQTAERATDLAAADLAEQRLMARAAQDTLTISRWHLLVAVIGTLGLGLTVWLTYWAASAARVAAVAAKEALTIERPWVLASGTVTSFRPVIGSPGVHQMHFDVRWMNSGRTPALDVQFWSEIAVVKAGDPEPPFDLEWGDGPSVAMGPGGAISGGNVHAAPEHTRGLLDGSLVAYIQAIVRYKAPGDADYTKGSQATFRGHPRPDVNGRPDYGFQGIGTSTAT